MEIVQRETKKRTKGESGLKLRGAMSKTGASFKTLFTKKKKLLILSTMFALLCVTGYLNFTLNNQRFIADEPISAVETNMFNVFRTQRADERTRDILVYENLRTSANAETVASAEAKLAEIRANVEFESTAEGLILVQEGYADILVNRTNGFVNVLIKRAENITSEQAVKIMTILQSCSLNGQLDIDNVYISFME